MTDMPGPLIVPHDQDVPRPPATGMPEPERPIEPEQPAPPPTPLPEPTVVAPALIANTPQPGTPNNAWQSNLEANTTGFNGTNDSEPDSGDINWTASEFIEHHKGAGWYAMLLLVGLAIAGIIYFLTKDKLSTGVVLLVIASFAAFAARKPRTQSYRLGMSGMYVGNKQYNFHDFKTFSVSEEGAVVSIVFMPLKRFMPPLTIYVAPDVEERVVAFLSDFLPFEQHRTDAVDSLMRRIRF